MASSHMLVQFRFSLGRLPWRPRTCSRAPPAATIAATPPATPTPDRTLSDTSVSNEYKTEHCLPPRWAPVTASCKYPTHLPQQRQVEPSAQQRDPPALQPHTSLPRDSTRIPTPGPPPAAPRAPLPAPAPTPAPLRAERGVEDSAKHLIERRQDRLRQRHLHKHVTYVSLTRHDRLRQRHPSPRWSCILVQWRRFVSM